MIRVKPREQVRPSDPLASVREEAAHAVHHAGRAASRLREAFNLGRAQPWLGLDLGELLDRTEAVTSPMGNLTIAADGAKAAILAELRAALEPEIVSLMEAVEKAQESAGRRANDPEEMEPSAKALGTIAGHLEAAWSSLQALGPDRDAPEPFIPTPENLPDAVWPSGPPAMEA